MLIRGVASCGEISIRCQLGRKLREPALPVFAVGIAPIRGFEGGVVFGLNPNVPDGMKALYQGSWVRVPAADTLNLFSHVIKIGTEHLLRRGLDRGYVCQKQEIQAVRGKIDFTASITALGSRRLQLTCDFDDFVPDVLHNQILRSTIRKLSQARGVDRTLRNDLRALDRCLEGISVIQLNSRVFRRVQLHRNNAFYTFLMRICELLHSVSMPNRGEDGTYLFQEVLDDESYMSLVFEKFVRRFYGLEQTSFSTVASEHLNWDASA
jgi:5-methylcytosine-specific restriction enzyme subunit McrC